MQANLHSCGNLQRFRHSLGSVVRLCLLSRKHFFANAPSPCFSTLSVLAQTSSGMFVSCMPWKIWFWIYFSAGELASSGICHWLLFLVASQVTFYLTPPALPAYTSSFLCFISECPFQRLSSTIWSSLQLPSFIWWFVFTPWILCSHLVLSFMYLGDDWSETIIFLFPFLCGALKGSDFTESEEDDGHWQCRIGLVLHVKHWVFFRYDFLNLSFNSLA